MSLEETSLCSLSCNVLSKILFSLRMTNQYFSIVDKDSSMSIFDRNHLSTGRIMDQSALPWKAKQNKREYLIYCNTDLKIHQQILKKSSSLHL